MNHLENRPVHKVHAWFVLPLCANAFARLIYSLVIVCGCTYLVFWRGESAWLYVFAVFLLRFRWAF